ncbi:MAG: hypothetical protein JHC61_08935 [Burkholderiaceae bacterium]|nr:hypothetical protein [Burkholderiaceae bacterium]
MTTATLNTARMTDALERDLLRSAMDNQQEFSLTAAFKRVVAALKSFVEFANEVSESMDEARRRSAFHAGSQW